MTIWRKITASECYTPHHARKLSKIKLTLECGHEEHRNYSQFPKGNEIRCPQCEDLQQRKKGSIWGSEGSQKQEVWDEATQMPKLVPYEGD